MPSGRYESWGGLGMHDAPVEVLRWRCDEIPGGKDRPKPLLPYGNGRSYGDVCLNDHGGLLDCRGLDRFISFDPSAGLLRCEAGVLVADILDLVVPSGWFLPVVPGTRWITVGGAIANDIHGKNHHRAGTIGCHVQRLELLRCDGSRRVCSEGENPDWFRATVGGLGLTGVVTWVEIRLKRIPGADIDCESIRFERLADFFALAEESDRSFEYTVAWVDALKTGKRAGRGLFFRGNHGDRAVESATAGRPEAKGFSRLPRVRVVTRPAVRVFNELYYSRQIRQRRRYKSGYRPFFFPLDAVGGWNRLYGPGGLLQYQFVVPMADAEEVVGEVLALAARSSSTPFLTVLKVFGDRQSPGLLSFPAPGATMALDFPHLGESTLRLLDQFDRLVGLAGGSIYPAKDARMTAEVFNQCFPGWHEMAPYLDPGISSSFWRRVTGKSE
jgi:FAD/FMN-containing dehydrogenase